MHHFKSISEFKLELQSVNTQLGSKSTIISLVTLKFDGWPWKNNRAPLLCYFKLCASFRSHWWIQTWVTVRKRLSWVLTSVTLTFDLWSRPFVWTSLLSLVIIPENFMMIRWWEHNQKGVRDGHTDRQTDWNIHIAAWSQLKTNITWYITNCASFMIQHIVLYFINHTYMHLLQFLKWKQKYRQIVIFAHHLDDVFHTSRQVIRLYALEQTCNVYYFCGFFHLHCEVIESRTYFMNVLSIRVNFCCSMKW